MGSAVTVEAAAAASAASLPDRFTDIEELEDVMTRPSAALVADLAGLDGDILILGVGGKMGPTLARMARRAAPDKRIIGVARFTNLGLRERLEAQGIDCLAADLLEPDGYAGLLKATRGAGNVVFMAGHKFGAADNAGLTWAMNAGVPLRVAETWRDARIVAFSTACVYPFVATDGPGADESTPATPPPGDYAGSCVGRERMFEYGSRRFGTPGRLVRLSYAIDCRYGVLHDVAQAVWRGEPLDLTMGWADVIWQGDANEQALRLLAHCTTPTAPVNVSGARHTSIRRLALAFGERFGREPRLTGSEAATAWLVDTSEARRLFGEPSVALETMIDWVADWVRHGRSSLGKPTHFQTRDGRY